MDWHRRILRPSISPAEGAAKPAAIQFHESRTACVPPGLRLAVALIGLTGVLACGDSQSTKSVPPTPAPRGAAPPASALPPRQAATAAQDPVLKGFQNDPLVKALFDLKRRDGRDNAMIDYLAALRLTGEITGAEPEDLIQLVLEDGWASDTVSLLPFLTRLKPAFDRIRNGAERDSRRNFGWDKGWTTPRFHRDDVLYAGKMLCVAGRRLESLGNHAEALDSCYMPTLTMARDFGAHDATLHATLYSLEIQSIALGAIHDLASSGRLDRAALLRALARLEEVDKTRRSVAEVYRTEAGRMSNVTMERVRRNPKAALRTMLDLSEVSGVAKYEEDEVNREDEGPGESEEEFTVEQLEEISEPDLLELIDRFEAEEKKFAAFRLEYAATPYWERDRKAYTKKKEQLRDSFHPLTREFVKRDFLPVDVHFFSEEARLRAMQLTVALAAYRLEKGRCPQRLSELTPAYFEALPIDPFSGKAFLYSPAPDGTSYTLHSIGPDRKDDGGAVEFDFDEGAFTGGDIVFRPASPGPGSTASRVERILRRHLDDRIVRDLLELKKKDGRDNAMLHYVAALELMGDPTDDQPHELITKAIKEGWSEETTPILPYIMALQPVFDRIRTGAELDYAKNVGYEVGIGAPMPNFSRALFAAKMLCATGRYLESQGKDVEALDGFYLPALTMARDWGAPNAVLIGNLMSISFQHFALDVIHDQAVSGRLDRPTLLRLLTRLKEIEKTRCSLVDAIRMECVSMGKAHVEDLRQDPKGELRGFLTMKAMMDESAGDEDVDEWMERTKQRIAKELDALSEQDLQKLIDRIEEEQNRYWTLRLEYAATPYWKRDIEAFEKKRGEMQDSFHAVAQEMSSHDPLDTDVRYFVAESRLLAAQLGAALAAYRMEKDRYPARLAELVPAYFKSLPVDPFSGKEFVYRPSPDGATYTLHGIGPDRKDDGGGVKYEPTNGTISPGDIPFPSPPQRGKN